MIQPLERLAGLHALHHDDADGVVLVVHHEMNHGRYSIRMITRRRFLQPLGALGAARRIARGSLRIRSRWASASGYPTPGRRRALDAPRGDPRPRRCRCAGRCAADERHEDRSCAAANDCRAAEWAHSVHVEVTGLEPERWYWYRFTPATRKARSAARAPRPPPSARPPAPALRLRLLPALRAGLLTAPTATSPPTSPDLVAFLGDYIYESSWGRDHVRKHDAAGAAHARRLPQPLRALQERTPTCRRRTPPVPGSSPGTTTRSTTTTPTTGPRTHRCASRSSRAAPPPTAPTTSTCRCRAHAARTGRDMRIYTTLDWGGLARFYVLDDRQYRSHQACPRAGRGGGNTVDGDDCAERLDPGARMLGARAGALARGRRSASRARWNVIAQQTLMAQFDQQAGPGRRVLDRRLGRLSRGARAAARRSASRKIANPVVLGGDVHTFNVNQLKPDFDDPASPSWRASSSAPRSPRRPGRRNGSTLTCRTTRRRRRRQPLPRLCARRSQPRPRFQPICVRWKACKRAMPCSPGLWRPEHRQARQARSAARGVN